MKKGIKILMIISLVSTALLILASIIVIVLQKPICTMIGNVTQDNFILPLPIVVGNILTIITFTASFILTYLGSKKEDKIVFEVIAMIVFLVGTIFIVNLINNVLSNVYMQYLNTKYGSTKLIVYSNINLINSSIAIYTPFGVCKFLIVVAQALSIGRKLGRKE